ncbi:GntR family transcriptional regulator [Kiloniella laminariae]|uniref:GntR family transcriptional regulator n=1 Tax=Kiloniella laminariae TaxID=454162 RepID=A0ABT4LI35_9PROT|nr:GntR family transcriptional regulator [Kiloniella laminariae]MCZ4280763.1 GntR family transcriptional regulator [Kiloniella laminariae]
MAETSTKSSGFKRQTITEAVAEALREEILTGQQKEGVQLRQDAIASRFNVSRIPVREALRQLEAEGLVTFYPHKGAVVSILSRTEICELFDIRRLLESDLLKRAIPQMTQEVLDEAENILKRYDIALENGEVALWGELNARFHHILYVAADRPKTLAIVQNLHNNIDRYLRIQLSNAGARSKARDDHWKIYNYCKKGQIEEATSLLDQHIQNGCENLITFLDSQVPSE